MADPQFRLPEGTRPGRTALSVADLEETVGFYRDVVGLDLLGREGAGAVLGAGETPLLALSRDEDAPPRPGDAAGLYHDAFRVPSGEALGEALMRVRDRWTLSGAADHGVSEALYLSDPEGNGVEIYRDRPREEWPTTEDGRVRMYTRPLDLDALAERASGEGRVPPGTDLGHVHLEVTSLARARRFYVETLGLEVRQEVESALFLAAGSYHHHVGLNAWGGRSRPAEGRGLAWFELVVPDPEVVETVRRRVTEAGATSSPIGDGIEVVDPDGIAVRLRPEK